MPPARPQACDLEVGGKEPDAFGGNPGLENDDFGARELRESRGSRAKRKHFAPFSFPILLFFSPL